MIATFTGENKVQLMQANENIESIKFWPSLWLEGVLLGSYAAFWLVVIGWAEEWDWLRGDGRALIIYGVWGLIIIGFCSYRQKKWIIRIGVKEKGLTYRKIYSIRPQNRNYSDLIVVHRTKKGKVLFKVYTRYCEFLGRFCLDKAKASAFLKTLRGSEAELVDDGG